MEQQEKTMITFEEFKKTELRVATIETAERVEGSEKLIKLQLDLGGDPSTSSGQGKRQIVAGIGKRYTPEELIGKQIVIVANLASRALMGIESHGMLLAASDVAGPVLLTPMEGVEPGAQVG